MERGSTAQSLSPDAEDPQYRSAMTVSKAVMSSAYMYATFDDRSLSGAQEVVAKWFLRDGDTPDDKLLRQEQLVRILLVCGRCASTRW